MFPVPKYAPHSQMKTSKKVSNLNAKVMKSPPRQYRNLINSSSKSTVALSAPVPLHSAIRSLSRSKSFWMLTIRSLVIYHQVTSLRHQKHLLKRRKLLYRGPIHTLNVHLEKVVTKEVNTRRVSAIQPFSRRKMMLLQEIRNNLLEHWRVLAVIRTNKMKRLLTRSTLWHLKYLK